MNGLWLFLLVAGTAVGAWRGQGEAITQAVMRAGEESVQLALALSGILCLWLGLLRIAEEAGLVTAVARALRPVLRPLFPSVPVDHPALGAMAMNLAANALGLGNAATPLGLRAMAELQRLNPTPEVASPAMCTFLALNTTGLTLLPTTIIALRALNGSHSPADIVLPTAAATAASTAVAALADRIARWASAR